MRRRWFTPVSAREALRVLRPLAETISRLYRELELRRPRAIVPDQPVDPDYFRIVARLCRTVEEIRRRGVLVGDPRRGMLNFPARRAGREVLLCWEVGETALEFWQEPDADREQRRRVDDDGPWERG